MAKRKKTGKRGIRLWAQLAFAALSNGYAQGFLTGRIYTGKAKLLCLPGLNCYSCPGALGSCPIGSLQAVLASRNYRFSFYVLGFLMLFGSLIGRLVCGWLCPFGMVQDLLYRIPFPKKRKNLAGHRFLVWLKYLILAVFVVLLPLCVADVTGQGTPWFCKYLCPSGTLGGGVFLVAANESLQQAIGWLYRWKMGILLLLLALSVAVYRPFCKYLCPLGALYGLFHPLSLYRYQVDREKCTACGKCQQVCKMDSRVWKEPNSRECIRCGECAQHCPEGAIRCGFGDSMKK